MTTSKFQILVTTTKSVTYGVAISTITVSFDTAKEAVATAFKINTNSTQNRRSTGVDQDAICLFDTNDCSAWD